MDYTRKEIDNVQRMGKTSDAKKKLGKNNKRTTNNKKNILNKKKEH